MTNSYSLKLGNVELKNPFILAPMAGITNFPFRVLCRKHGAGLVVSEMVSAEALVRGNDVTSKLLKTDGRESPFAVQIFGGNIDSMIRAAKMVEDRSICDIIDINMGCPASDIIRSGAGSILLCDIKKSAKMVKAVVDAVNIPVTAKIRLGFNNSKDCVKIAKELENTGIVALGVHGRTKKQGYSGKADWDAIKEIKKAISIPVIGNGDIKDPVIAKKYLDEGYCDALMIGRASIGNPFVFESLSKYYFDGDILGDISKKDKLDSFLEYFKLCEKNGIVKLADVKNQAQYFTKGLENSTSIRREISACKELIEIKNLIIKFKSENEE